MKPLRTKIVCTIGPASAEMSVLQALVGAGMDVARINFSHGSQAINAEYMAAVRRASHNGERPIALLADLQGPVFQFLTVVKLHFLDNIHFLFFGLLEVC